MYNTTFEICQGKARVLLCHRHFHVLSFDLSEQVRINIIICLLGRHYDFVDIITEATVKYDISFELMCCIPIYSFSVISGHFHGLKLEPLSSNLFQAHHATDAGFAHA